MTNDLGGDAVPPPLRDDVSLGGIPGFLPANGGLQHRPISAVASGHGWDRSPPQPDYAPGSVVNGNALRLGLQVNRDITPRWYVGIANSFTYDQIAGLDYRYQVAGVLGCRVWTEAHGARFFCLATRRRSRIVRGFHGI